MSGVERSGGTEPTRHLPEGSPMDSEPRHAERTTTEQVQVAVAEAVHGPSADASASEIAAAQEVTLASTESREGRTQRLSTGVLIAVLAAVLFALAFSANGTAAFALSDALAAKALPTLRVPGMPMVLISAVLMAAAAAGFLSGKLTKRWTTVAGTVAGLALVVGFLSWAASGRDLPFPVSNQLAGTIAVATPLVLGALCGVMCERAGVVNVAIEGQMLTGAFTAALVGSMTGSVTAALIAGSITGVVMGALLAVFSINYLMDQVVLGVVLNLLASGITGFLFDQLIKPNGSKYNAAPTLEAIPIPGLSRIPILGNVLFNQTILVYLAVLCVALVWFILNHTTWGLRIRSVGEHPEAADTVGINVRAVRWSAVLFGGLFAGLAGTFFTVGSVGGFTKDITVGNGFIALAALIMGRWKPVLAALMALFFGFVMQLSTQLQTIQTPINSQWMLMLPYVATIIAVAGLVGRVRGPKADGIPFIKS